MKIKFILPVLEEATSPYWRPIKYALFPPLGLATLASYCSREDELTIVDEHVETLDLTDSPELVCIQTYITNAYRAYEIADLYRARGIFVVLGGLHATSLPGEALQHADAIILGLGEKSFPHFLKDFREKNAQRIYSEADISFEDIPQPRRDLLKRENYLVPNSIVFSRGCPNRCSFCYVNSFYRGGKSYYTYRLDRILEEIDTLKGRHLYFLDDNLFADKKLCRDLFTQMRGMGKLFQGAITVKAVLEDDLVELARDAGFRSAFIGFESMNRDNLLLANKQSNINMDYSKVIKKLDRLGIMINGSFIFGMEHDDESVFDATTKYAIDSGITTATFHILTPYPGTDLYAGMYSANRITSGNWRDYDTRHLVFAHKALTRDQMEDGYKRAYDEFYRWNNIWSASGEHGHARMKLKHFIYSASWKKLEPVWNFVIKHGLLSKARLALESTLK